MPPEVCDHTDAYGSTIMVGGPYSKHPGVLVCIVCDEPGPFLRAVNWADAPELPAGSRFVKVDADGDRRGYALWTPRRGTVGNVTRITKAMPVYRNRRGRSSNGGGTYVEWAWAAACGHLSSASPGRSRYARRDTAAMVMLAEVERHDCKTGFTGVG